MVNLRDDPLRQKSDEEIQMERMQKRMDMLEEALEKRMSEVEEKVNFNPRRYQDRLKKLENFAESCTDGEKFLNLIEIGRASCRERV